MSLGQSSSSATVGDNGSDTAADSGADRPFVCGVVEGFYGRPWTLAQRKDLFEKMHSWGMSSYLYAPKDDCKHRAYWRELYTVEEADHLQSLISAASDRGIIFYYAISPGLDITYSNSKEVATLKRKLDQVAQLGCKAFALLFDDIEAEMSKPDKEAFQSFAAAQVSVTNEIFQHLGQPKFLFCPTQYCTTRATPTIATSEYLKTLGAKLAPDIDIMWTGDKVIPKDITVESLEEITMVLNRAPVIWDNEHANDYDQKRVYLGPYSGRSPDIIPKLRGVMTNPNCEYGANFVAIHSLAAWSRCTVDGCESLLSGNDTVTSDIKLEMGSSGDGSQPPPPPHNLPSHVYHPRHALRTAVSEWMQEMYKNKPMWGPITKPQVGLNPVGVLQPSVNTCLVTTSTTSSINTLLPISCTGALPGGGTGPPSPTKPEPSSVPVNPAEAAQAGVPLVTPLVPMMNSLVSHNVVVMERTVDTDMVKPGPEPMEVIPTSPGQCGVMDTVTSPPATPATTDMLTSPPTPSSVMDQTLDNNGGTLTKSESVTMLCDDTSAAPAVTNHCDSGVMSCEELEMLCDMFYLPWAHGPKAIQILNEFYWLKTHAGVMLNNGLNIQLSQDEEDTEEDVQVDRPEWLRRKVKFSELAGELRRAFEKLCNAPNRELVYNLYTYLWDIVSVVHMLLSYVEWLAAGRFSNKYKQLVIGRHTWFSGIREAFCSGDHEPWVFRGGLAADLQRLMPVDSGNDLFLYPYPETPTPQIYTIRPFTPQDTTACYSVTLQTWDDGIDATQFFTSCPNLVGEKAIGPFTNFYPELGFVLESWEGQVVGYVFAAPSLREYHQRMTNVWLPELRLKYPVVEAAEGELLTTSEAVINSLHKDPEPLPGYIDSPDTWSVLKLAVSPSVLDASLSRRAIMLMLACLRTCGTLKVICEIPKKERYNIDLFTKLGICVNILFHPKIETIMILNNFRVHAFDRDTNRGTG